ncbi:MAG: Ger(x)C family spore germination protein [Thermoanaerobacteraceae bacterium]|nr:Ger(x)C family spore germination protein [Thermoanaerobacteraceae bacterium]
MVTGSAVTIPYTAAGGTQAHLEAGAGLKRSATRGLPPSGRWRRPGWLPLVFSLVLLLFTGGCWGYREVDDSAYILILGVDKGRENLLAITAQIAVPRAMGAGGMGGGGGNGGAGGGAGGGGAGQRSTITITVESRSIITGLDLMNASVERRVNLKHLKALIFSDELAREGLECHLGPLNRFPEFRRNTFMAVSRGPAGQLVERVRPVMESNPAKYVELLITAQRYVGFSPFGQVHHFYNDLKSASVQPAAPLVAIRGKEHIHRHGLSGGVEEGDYLAGQLPRRGGEDVEQIGTAVFKGDRMVGELTGDETVILNMIKGQFRQGFFAFPDPQRPGYFIVLRMLAERKPQISCARLKDNTIDVRGRVSLEAEFASIQSGINYERMDQIPLIEAEVNRILEERAAALIRKSQEEFQSDIFGFGYKARHLAATWPQWQELNWLGSYPRAQVRITFKTHIRRIGLMRETSPARDR